jgi:hypothetical protein
MTLAGLWAAVKIVILGAVNAWRCARTEEDKRQALADGRVGAAYRVARKCVRTREGAQEAHEREMWNRRMWQ